MSPAGAGGATHQGFPVVEGGGVLVGVVTRRDLLGPEEEWLCVRDVVKRGPVVIFEDSTLREAADHMVREGVGRLVVVRRAEPWRVAGVISRSDLLAAHGPRIRAHEERERHLGWGRKAPAGVRPGSPS